MNLLRCSGAGGSRYTAATLHAPTAGAILGHPHNHITPIREAGCREDWAMLDDPARLRRVLLALALDAVAPLARLVALVLSWGGLAGL